MARQLTSALQGAGSIDRDLLVLWEQACALPPLERDDALLAFSEPEVPKLLGRRNAALLQFRARLFGNTLTLRTDCPACAASAEFGIDCQQLAQSLQPDDSAELEHALSLDGWQLRFRVPLADDLRAARQAADDEAFAQALMQRCVLQCQAPAGADEHRWPETLAEALSQRLEALDPGANVRFDLSCPECGTRWAPQLDVGTALWTELQARAERVLLDVDALARAYGWNEDEVLRLSPTRRAAYLQLVSHAA
jgi:hypothetical protein